MSEDRIYLLKQIINYTNEKNLQAIVNKKALLLKQRIDIIISPMQKILEKYNTLIV